MPGLKKSSTKSLICLSRSMLQTNNSIFPILYASGRNGWCVRDLADEQKDLTPLLELVLQHVPAPKVEDNKPFAMLATLLDSDPFLGRCLTGRVAQGSAKVNEAVKAIDLDGNLIENGRLTKLLKFEKEPSAFLSRKSMPAILYASQDLTKASVADTIGAPALATPLASTPIDPPTMAVTISVNDSPFAGKDGSKVTSTMIRERLLAEAETNVAITFAESEDKDSFEIGGRGELQLGVLIETMRREGFEMSVSRPKVLFRAGENGEKLEPYEEIYIDVDEGVCLNGN